EHERRPLRRDRVKRLRRVLQRERLFAALLEEARAAVVRRPPPEPAERARRDRIVEGRQLQRARRLRRRALRELERIARVGVALEREDREVERARRLADRERRARRLRRDVPRDERLRLLVDELREGLEREARTAEVHEVDAERDVAPRGREARRAQPR